MNRTRSRYLPSRSPEPPPVVPGLGPDSLAGLTLEAVSARSTAAAERSDAADRRAAARGLADRVSAATPPPRPTPAPEPTATPVRPTRGKPWRSGPLVVSTRRADPESPPTFDEADAAALLRLLNRTDERNTP